MSADCSDAVSTESAGGAVSAPLLATPAAAADAKHIMVSYQWDHKPAVIKLCAELRGLGYDVWRDEDGSGILEGMSGDTAARMSEAVERSSCVIVCVSRKYVTSTNCQREAQYADLLQTQGRLKIVFAMMDNSFTTVSAERVGGWLGFLIGQALWYPMWNDAEIASSARRMAVSVFGSASLRPGFQPPLPSPLALAPARVSSGGSDSHHFCHTAALAGDESSDMVYVYSSPLVELERGRPKLCALLNTRGEFDELKTALGETHKSISLRAQIATSKSICDTFNRGVRCLHFSGHGKKEFLAFEQENAFGEMVAASPENLRVLLEQQNEAARRLEFVFISACHSERYAQVFADFGVKHVVAITLDEPVRDAAAIVFTNALYTQLFLGDHVRKAFELAKLRVREHKLEANSLAQEEAKFILLPRDRDHNEPLEFCARLAKGKVFDQTARLSRDNPHVGDTFMREIVQMQMYKLMRLLQDNCRIVSVFGDSGVGKSSLLIACIEYMIERGCTFAWVSCDNKFQFGHKFHAQQDAASVDSIASFVANALTGAGLNLGADVVGIDALVSELNALNRIVWIAFDAVATLAEQDKLDCLMGDGGLVQQVLTRCPKVRLVFTSRRTLDDTVPGFDALTERCRVKDESIFVEPLNNFNAIFFLNSLFKGAVHFPLPRKSDMEIDESLRPLCAELHGRPDVIVKVGRALKNQVAKQPNITVTELVQFATAKAQSVFLEHAGPGHRTPDAVAAQAHTWTSTPQGPGAPPLANSSSSIAPQSSPTGSVHSSFHATLSTPGHAASASLHASGHGHHVSAAAALLPPQPTHADSFATQNNNSGMHDLRPNPHNAMYSAVGSSNVAPASASALGIVFDAFPPAAAHASIQAPASAPRPNPVAPTPVPPFRSMEAQMCWLHIVNSTIPNANATAQNTASWSQQVIPWQCVRPVLMQAFGQLSGSGASRAITEAEAESFATRACPPEVGHGVQPAFRHQYGDMWTNAVAFAAFFPWLQDCARVVAAMATEWNLQVPGAGTPFVHGFINKVQSEQLLMVGRFPGMFVLRFSETQIGKLGCAFVDQNNTTQHMLFEHNGSGFLATGSPFVYSTFSECILKCQLLAYVYPGVPKDAALLAPYADGPM